jgi:hypothetical protein
LVKERNKTQLTNPRNRLIMGQGVLRVFWNMATVKCVLHAARYCL